MGMKAKMKYNLIIHLKKDFVLRVGQPSAPVSVVALQQGHCDWRNATGRPYFLSSGISIHCSGWCPGYREAYFYRLSTTMFSAKTTKYTIFKNKSWTTKECKVWKWTGDGWNRNRLLLVEIPERWPFKYRFNRNRRQIRLPLYVRYITDRIPWFIVYICIISHSVSNISLKV